MGSLEDKGQQVFDCNFLTVFNHGLKDNKFMTVTFDKNLLLINLRKNDYFFGCKFFTGIRSQANLETMLN